MALILCPECLKEVSDKAQNCPNCGYPLTNESNTQTEIDLDENIRLISVDKEVEEKPSENSPFAKDSALWVLIGAIVIGAFVWMYQGINNQYWEYKLSKEDTYEPKITGNYSGTTSTSIPDPRDKRESFASSIKQALNAPGLPQMCERAYFNDLGELIIEVNGEWIVLDDGLKKDMIYAIKELLKKKKSDLGVEGYGQFFSTSGQGLESFYAK